MSDAVRCTGRDIRKEFDRRSVFRGVSFAVERGETLLVTGRNGSGKSTLVKIICGVLSPTAGGVTLEVNGATSPDARLHAGLVAPYLQMFEEFSPLENLQIASGLRGMPFDRSRAAGLLERVGLAARLHDPVRTFSSGMKQRVKYAFALLHEPRLLVLDEPTANLDDEGIAVARGIMAEQRRRGALVVATNDPGDVETFERSVDLNAAR